MEACCSWTEAFLTVSSLPSGTSDLLLRPLPFLLRGGSEGEGGGRRKTQDPVTETPPQLVHAPPTKHPLAPSHPFPPPQLPSPSHPLAVPLPETASQLQNHRLLTIPNVTRSTHPLSPFPSVHTAPLFVRPCRVDVFVSWCRVNNLHPPNPQPSSSPSS